MTETKPKKLRYVETEGGPFILLPYELRKAWAGVGDDADDKKGDYARAVATGLKAAVLPVGEGQAMILGSCEVTAFVPTDDGGVFVQRVLGDRDRDVRAAVAEALTGAGWVDLPFTFDVGSGSLRLFDSAYAYADADADERLKITLAPGRYRVDHQTVKTDDVDVQLYRLRQTSA